MRLESVDGSDRGLGGSVGIVDANETQYITRNDHATVTRMSWKHGLYGSHVAERTVAKGGNRHILRSQVCMDPVEQRMLRILDKEQYGRFSRTKQPQLRNLLFWQRVIPSNGRLSSLARNGRRDTKLVYRVAARSISKDFGLVQVIDKDIPAPERTSDESIAERTCNADKRVCDERHLLLIGRPEETERLGIP